MHILIYLHLYVDIHDSDGLFVVFTETIVVICNDGLYIFYFDVEWLMLFNMTVTHELEYSNLVTLIWRVRCIFNLCPRCGNNRSLLLALVVKNLGRKFFKYNPLSACNDDLG